MDMPRPLQIVYARWTRSEIASAKEIALKGKNCFYFVFDYFD